MVTGAGRGIGQATAMALAEAGFAVGLVGRTREELEQTAAGVAERGMDQLVAVADVTNRESVHQAVTDIETRLSSIDVLVNNAGSMTAIGPIWEVDPDDWWTDVRTSLRGAFVCCREVVPGMIERHRGRVVNLTSYVAVRPSPYQSGYAAAKAGLASLTEALAASLEPHGVRAFAVSPAFTDTEMTRVARQSDAGARWLPGFGEGRVVDAERSAALITWLAGGFGDALNGRFLHTLDDVESLVERIDEVRRRELYVPRIRRLD
jgi:NAD(P)-dependent dehydrogenase (short-subunit alcohol dehydrogenase family)